MTRNSKRNIDVYTHHVMSAIDPEVTKTLNLVQLRAIRTAVSANAPFRQHAIDIRGVLPLYFLKLYFVILMGKDRRLDTRAKEQKRMVHMQGLSTFVFAYFMLAAAVPILLIVVYIIKSILGIDLFPDQHLFDFFKDL